MTMPDLFYGRRPTAHTGYPILQKAKIRILYADDIICNTVYLANKHDAYIIDFPMDDFIHIRDNIFASVHSKAK